MKKTFRREGYSQEPPPQSTNQTKRVGREPDRTLAPGLLQRERSLATYGVELGLRLCIYALERITRKETGKDYHQPTVAGRWPDNE